MWEHVLVDTVKKEACIPVSVPGQCYDKAKVEQMDGVVSIDAAWVKDTLLPACKKVGCYRERQ